CSAAIFQAKIPRVVIGAARSDLPHLMRERKFRIEHLAEDSGYSLEIVRGVLKEKVLGLFDGVRKRSAIRLHRPRTRLEPFDHGAQPRAHAGETRPRLPVA